ncbi:hypothetical protein CPB83DRAFT_394971 [Crepidotus variabilis]|uniref:DUF6533 domain-containing protein n=1 Tax=Crepidotus variabilis TaxID=179855 RepID=A0A9P6JNS1_9AGAR|nr:hypothetical protein CPB83DRAFT_394971 [Crepidotus variabilis]
MSLNMDFLIANERNKRMSRYPVVACYTALLYEFLIVFDQEWRLIYKSQWSLLKCLYLACRFAPIALWPVNMYSFMNEHTRQGCQPLVIFESLSFGLLLALPQCIYVLRAWSITGRMRPLLVLFLACFGAYLTVVVWAATDDFSVGNAGFDFLGKAGCYRNLYHNQNPFARPIFAGIVLDIVVGGVIVVYYHFTIRRSSGRLGKLILHQDLLFFPSMLLLDALAGIIFTHPLRFLDGIVFTGVLLMSNVMACRFILQIRETSSTSLGSELQQLSAQVQRDLILAEIKPTTTMKELRSLSAAHLHIGSNHSLSTNSSV